MEEESSKSEEEKPRNLIVTSIEFHDQVTIHWYDIETGETGTTTMSYEAYRTNQKPL